MTSHVAYVFVDTEATGLDTAVDCLLEVAVILTDHDLNELAAYQTLIRADDEAWRRIADDPVVERMHLASGLIGELRACEPGALPSVAQAEQTVLEMLDDLGVAAPLRIAGGGVAQFDQPLLRRLWPGLDARFHYRPHDTSIITQELGAALGLDLVTAWKNPARAHRAMVDLREDLAIARTLRELLRTIDSAALSAVLSRQ